MGSPAAPTPREYVLGVDDAELARLGLQHSLWAGYALDLWERAGLRPGMTVLDLGCGPGFATLDLASLTGAGGRVIGVDESARFVETLEARRAARGLTNVEVRVADVQRLDLPAASIDFAYARWVFCFLADPDAAVASVARALRPGGVFCVQDYFNYRSTALAPRSAVFERIVQATDQSWRVRGGDPDIVGRLPAMMARHDLEVREIRPIVRVARAGTLLWEWPASFWKTYTRKLVEMGLVSEADEREFQREWAARSKDPATFFQTPPVWDLIAVKR